MKTLEQLQKEFGARAVTLNTGAAGLRGGIHCTVTKTGTNTIQFIGSDNTLDRYNEVVDQKGWQLENFRANPVIPDCHDYSSIAKILGRASSVEVKDGKLVNDVEFCLDNPLGNLAFKMAAGGFIRSQSVGFIPLEWTNGKTADQPERTYTKCELLEISLVVVPANPGATVGLALKSGAISKLDVKRTVEFLSQFCSEEKPDPAGKGSASAAGVHDARLLHLARSLNSVLTK